MRYHIYINGELVGAENSFMNACLYMSEHLLTVIGEDSDENTVNLYCVEA